MTVVFQRIGPRKYAVVAKRSRFPDLEMNGAPGYDPLMPHDLMHLVVEAQLGLTRGIFGQLAAGGDAGTFRRDIKPNETPRVAARIRNRVKARGKKLAETNWSNRSELHTFAGTNGWPGLSRANEGMAHGPWPNKQRKSETLLPQRKHVYLTGRSSMRYAGAWTS
jgi:hypothetical protein